MYTRSGRKGSSYRGLFTKERTYATAPFAQTAAQLPRGAVRNLMYGFGDDRNPANDTVNVMEEILIEYIVDVVRFVMFLCPHVAHNTCFAVPDSVRRRQEVPAFH